MNNEDLYKRYPHIIRGSIEDIDRGQIVVGGRRHKIKSHGKIAVIKCANADAGVAHCMKTRIINVQDASQTKFCQVCTRYNRNERRRHRRNSTKTK